MTAADSAPSADLPAIDLPAIGLPATDLPATNLPATNPPAIDRVATNLPATDRAATDRAATDPPAANPAAIARPELLAPAGDWDCVKAAVENGADAVYFGLDRFNARMRAQNFTEADLPELMAFLHRRGVRGYLTVNTLIFPEELAAVERYLKTAIAAGVDAAIVQDVGLVRLLRHLSPDFPVHASTQMTVTSAAGVAFARALGCRLVVLARECSLKEIRKIQQQTRDRGTVLPLETFVHGALCVAYSGQCLTSEALGGRSANRGECAQACRMPYELLADGEPVDLGERAYLLSPQDLAGLPVVADLMRAGVASLKIEGRLKAPEYVASVTRVYRQAIDRAAAQFAAEPRDRAPSFPELFPASPESPDPDGDRYALEMAFSRGLHTGWLEGIDNQKLVAARYAKKRGAYLGEVVRVQQDRVVLRSPSRNVSAGDRVSPGESPGDGASQWSSGNPAGAPARSHPAVKPGDGVVFELASEAAAAGGARELGGRVYQADRRGADWWLGFGRDFDPRSLRPGMPCWKTSDPALDKQVRQTYSGDRPRFQRPVDLEVFGALGEPLTAIARDEFGAIARVASAMPLVAADRRPLDEARLREQFGRLGNTPFRLGSLDCRLSGPLMLPASELNRMRRDWVAGLEAARSRAVRWTLTPGATGADLLPVPAAAVDSPDPDPDPDPPTALAVLVRNRSQLEAAIAAGTETIYAEFEDPRAYRDAVAIARGAGVSLWVAPPRVTKPGETWILQQVRRSNADGYLVRNYDHLEFFAAAGDRCIGDFSLNVANPLAANYFKTRYGLERLVASYDLNADQLADLLRACPPDWFEVTLHQHVPMFHMEHCAFCAFLSDGTDYTNCGRPCETRQVRLRDRAGVEHVLSADAGCRNTVFNGTAQTGAEFYDRLRAAGLRRVRVEFLRESPEAVAETIARYRDLLAGRISGSQLWRDLQLHSQLGVTRGQLGQPETVKVRKKAGKAADSDAGRSASRGTVEGQALRDRSSDSQRSNSKKSVSKKSDPKKSESRKLDSKKSDSSKSESRKSESRKPESKRLETVRSPENSERSGKAKSKPPKPAKPSKASRSSSKSRRSR